mmetsp:Transcript_68809/g.165172  ORF Transcript_68809/g.165172 Transcript_68809/m.165172 type:complete len:80 (-) Transcript_68809:2291-2530(-)
MTFLSAGPGVPVLDGGWDDTVGVPAPGRYCRVPRWNGAPPPPPTTLLTGGGRAPVDTLTGELAATGRIVPGPEMALVSG